MDTNCGGLTNWKILSIMRVIRKSDIREKEGKEDDSRE